MRYWVGLVLVVVLLGFVSAGDVDGDVIEAFDSGEESIEVIVELRDESVEIGVLSLDSGAVSIEDVVNEEKVTYRFENSVAVEINKEGLDDLSKNVNVKSVVKMGEIYALLHESVDIINSSSTWELVSFGVNLTGVKESVCVIDSGVNYSHPDLAGSYLGGYDFVESNDDPMDGFGHGTHVAGIIAASGGTSGVAPDVGIVALRVLNDTGGGSPSDLVSAIDWCVANASVFNISVISMSLGCTPDVGGYSSYCDDIDDGCWNPAIANAINSAVLNNISVVAASGNLGGVDNISSPACIQNSIAVSSIDKNSSVSFFSDRNLLVNLLAPGGDINSTRWNPSGTMNGCGSYNGNYMVCSGTSMAAPMVSGVIALINQYLGLSGQGRTPSQIESILNDTGRRINDSGGSNLNFSIVDSYAAVTSLDIDVPNVTLVSPTNGAVDMDVNQTFVCNATDWQLANVTLSVWNSSGLIYNATNNLSWVANESSFNVTNLGESTYSWNCLVVDSLGNSASASANFSLVIDGISTTLVSPADGSYGNVETNFSCRVVSESEYALSNVTFYLWNSSGLVYNLSANISGTDNTSVFNYSFVDDASYSWNCLGVNNVSESSWADSNYSFVFDSVDPVISSVSSGNPGDTDAEISWDTDEATNSSVDVSGGSWSDSANYVTSHSVDVSALAPSSTYTYSVTSCDRAGNCATDSNNNFSTDASSVSVTISSGGGSGDDSVSASSLPAIHNISVAEVLSGYTEKLKKDDKVEFSIFDFEGGRHSLSVDEVGEDYVEFTIESEPISLRLGVGQSVKLNLTSPIYYDLLVRLNAIIDDGAEMTIQLINETIEIKTVEITGNAVGTGDGINENYLQIIAVLVGVLVGIVFIVLKKDRKELKGSKSKKKDGKDKKTKA
jgi:subtilisin